MSRYYKAEDVISFLNMNCPKDMWEYQIADLPTIKVSEDCVDKYTVLAELDPRSVEYKIIKDLPSVVPQVNKNEWVEEFSDDGWRWVKDEL